MIQTHFTQWKGDTNLFYSINGWQVLILPRGRVKQTHFTRGRVIQTHLLNERVTQTHLTQFKGDTNSFYCVEEWYKLIWHSGRVIQTHFTLEGWYKLILLSGRVIQTHFTLEEWYKLILLGGSMIQTHFTLWKGDTNSFYSMEEWNTLIAFNIKGDTN